MLRLIPRKLLLQVGFATLSFPALASGQIFARAAIDVETRGNASCGLSSCSPRTWVYGYYHEHWRRWPEEPASSFKPDALSPFARPENGLPATELPEPRMEETMAPQRPPASAGAARPAQTPAPAAPQVRPPGGPATDRTDASGETPPSGVDLPFEQPSQPSGQDDFFPTPDDPNASELPESFPEPSQDTTLPPLDLDSSPPAEEFDLGPAENDADDVFNLDDFGQVNPQRLQRYRMSANSRMRRVGTTRPRPASQLAAPRHAPVQLAAYRQLSGGRRNPLRANTAPPERETPVFNPQPPSWPTEPIAVEPIKHHQEAPLEWSQPVDATERLSGRANPLR